MFFGRFLVKKFFLRIYNSVCKLDENKNKSLLKKEKLDFKEVESFGKEVAALVKKYNLNDVNLDVMVIPEQQLADKFVDDDILPELPCYFKISKFKGISKNTNKIHLEVVIHLDSPRSVCGDGCGVNMKGSRPLEEMCGIKSSFTRCSSHASLGTIRRLCTKKTMFQSDAQALYENLRKVHFSKSPKNSELLTKALDALELN